MNTIHLIGWKSFFSFYLLSLSICLSAQQVDIALLGEMDCIDNSYCISIGVKSNSDIFEIGTSSIFLDYNENALEFDSYTSSAFDGSANCIANVASAWDGQSYDGNSVAGDFNLTMTLLSSSFSCPSITPTSQEVGVICFNVLNSTIDPEIKINSLNTQFNSALTNNGTDPISVGTTDDINEIDNSQCDPCDASLVGQVCDDNNPCTEGDQYDVDCNCAGVLADADADGVCDADDICPTGDDNLDGDNDGIPDACDELQPAIAGLIINEIHYNPNAGDDAEFIELVNTTNSSIELQGIAFSSGVTYSFAQPYVLPGTANYPQNYIVIARDSLTFIDTYGFAPYGDYGGKLSNSGELVQLIDASDNILDEVEYEDSVPWDTIPDGGLHSLALMDLNLDNSQAVNWKAQPILVTPGTVNDFGAVDDSDGDGIADNLDQCPGIDDGIVGTACDDDDPCTSGETYDASCNCSNGVLLDANNDAVCDFEQRDYAGIVINEIYYNPEAGDDAEFIEIVNTSNAAIDLVGVHFSEGVDFVFEESFLLPGASDYPQNYLVIAKDSAFFIDEYNVPLYGEYSGKLSNGGEEVTIADPLGNVIDELSYEDDLPWDSIPDNGLHSLALLDLTLDNSLASSWRAQNPAFTTPGMVNVFDTTIPCDDEDSDGICDTDDDCDNRKEGTACDDNNSCTQGEVYDNNCNCIGGTLIDSDNDTVCDQDDQCPNLDDRLLGTACDDGNPNTGNDIYDLTTCSCAGTVGSTAVTQTTCKRVDNSFDDVEENTTDGFVDQNSSDIELIFNRDYNQVIGLRFGNSEIPQGATIISATVLFTADETSSDPVNLIIKGEATDDAVSFEATAYNVSTRPTTNASASWSPQAWLTVGDAGAAQTTTDIASIIQEIVNRPNYQSGNAIALIFEGTGKRTAESFDGSPSEAAELCITYSIEVDEPTACVVGAACDDGDSCTIDDYLDADCNCISDTISPDSDNDGICDANDTTNGDCIEGAACDDGDPCTIGDYLDANCNCIFEAISPDSDNDGICDVDDITNGDCTEGAACDDGDPCTVGDYLDADCNCISDTFSPDIDNDGVCDAEDLCSNLDDNLLGQACDDGLANTINDTYQSSTCSCAGTLVEEETGCGVSVSVTGSTINITGLDETIVSVKLYDKNFNTVNECDTWNIACSTSEMFSDLPDGQYYLSVGTFDENWMEICKIFEEIALPYEEDIVQDSDSDGVMDDEDCQPLVAFYPATPGTNCNDNDPTTTNDVVQEDGCSCAGIYSENNCNANYSIDGNILTVTGLNNEIVSLKILDSQWQTVYECDNWAIPCNTTEIIDQLPDGDYLISIGTFTKDWNRLCSIFEAISLPATTSEFTLEDIDGDGILNDFDCAPSDASLPAPVGSSCDDADDNTIEDVIQEDGCTCSGTVPDEESGCSNIEISTTQSGANITGMNDAPITTVHVYTDKYELVYSCAADCQATESIDLSAGTYFVYARYYTATWGLICETNKTITVEGNQGLKTNTSSSRNKAVDSFPSRVVFKEDIRMYPNPASANVFIDFRSYAGQKGILQIHNSVGQIITSERMDNLPSNPFQIDLSNTDAGLHIVSLQLESGTVISKKLIVK